MLVVRRSMPMQAMGEHIPCSGLGTAIGIPLSVLLKQQLLKQSIPEHVT